MRITIKAARINKGFTQEFVAAKIGVTKKTLGSWENGKTMPKADKIILLCNLYGTSYDDIEWKPNFFKPDYAFSVKEEQYGAQ